MPERYRAPHQRALERLRETGEFRLRDRVVTMHGLHKDGREFPIEMSLSSWVSEGRRFHCGIARDVTGLAQVWRDSMIGAYVAHFGYDVNDKLSLSFEGLNLTEEDVRWHGRSVLQPWYIEDQGARYALGARYRF